MTPALAYTHTHTASSFCPSSRIYTSLYDIYQQRVFTDVTICIGKARILAHRVVLAMHSPFFRAMFTSGMEESRKGEIYFDSVDAQSCAMLVDYIYSGTLMDITGENVLALLDTSDQLEIEVGSSIWICCSIVVRFLTKQCMTLLGCRRCLL